MAITPVADCPAGPLLDAAVAKVLGNKIAFDEQGWPYHEHLVLAGVIIKYVESYSTDAEAARELENGLPVGLREKYVELLLAVCGFDVQIFDMALERNRPDVSIPEALCSLVFASPLQRSKAFLLASGVERIET